MAKDRFLRGALILTVAGLLVKVIGSVNRILLSRYLGGEGIGLYQLAYPIYLLTIAISVAGIPVAVSIMVSQAVAGRDYRGAKRIFRISLGSMVLVGLAFALGLFFLAGFLVDSGVIRDGRAYWALIALTPAVFLATVLACFRGYFQGFQLMTPTALSQIVEQLVRVCTMLLLAYLLMPRGLEFAAAGAAFGAVPGAFLGILVLCVCYRKYRHYWQETGEAAASEVQAGEVVKTLLKLAIPVSCANLTLPLVNGIDMLFVPQRLEAAGFSTVEATTAFGYLTGMALPLVMMATIPTLSLNTSVVPAIAEAVALGDKAGVQEKAAKALRFCLLLTIPASFGMWALSLPISRMLYGTPLAAPSIAHLAPSIAFLGLSQVTTGILQGMGHTVLPMVNMLVSAAFKIVLVWQLTAMPALNIVGAAWASNLNFALTTALNLYFLYKVSPGFYPVRTTLNSLVASAIMGLAAGFCFHNILQGVCGLVLGTLLSIALGMAVYVGCLWVLREFSIREIREYIRKR